MTSFLRHGRVGTAAAAASLATVGTFAVLIGVDFTLPAQWLVATLGLAGGVAASSKRIL